MQKPRFAFFSCRQTVDKDASDNFVSQTRSPFFLKVINKDTVLVETQCTTEEMWLHRLVNVKI